MNEYLNKKYNIPYFNTEKTIENIKSDDIYTIICVKWGKKYGSEYVNKLSRAIKKYIFKIISKIDIFIILINLLF